MSSRYRAILADMDGTVNKGDTLLRGARSVYEELSAEGIHWFFISNNASVLPADLALKLRNLGIAVSDDQVINSATALLQHLANESGVRNVFVVGQERLIEAVRALDINIVEDPYDVDAVIVAIDRGFTYEKLEKALTAIHNGARFWATNLDASLPVENGLKPGAGSIVAAVATASGRSPDRVFGKPESDMAGIVLERLGLEPRDCLIVGDRMETDIMFAKNAGMDSVLVLTGATSRERIVDHSFAPTYVIESIADLKSIF